MYLLCIFGEDVVCVCVCQCNVGTPVSGIFVVFLSACVC